VIHKSAIIYGKTIIGENSYILENVILGYPDRQILKAAYSKNIKIEDYQYQGTQIGQNALIRANTVIYCKVSIGDDFQTGHNVLIRENTIIGNHVSVGTNTVIEGDTRVGNNVNIQSNVFIPKNTIIEDFVFIAPNAVLTNDKYPIRKHLTLKGPVIRKGASIGANAIILPGIEVGVGSMIAAGAVVTTNIPQWKLAIGSPARIVELSEELKVFNKI